MARVVLITTGSMEELAFPRSLARLFPEHEFIARPRLDGFTSFTLPPDYAALRDERPLLNIEKFAKTLIGQIAGGRRDEPRVDYVVALEDMELRNSAAPERITRALRDAVARNLEGWGDGSTPRRLGDALRARCSFHLMAPMTEAYFFADPTAFARATAPGPHHPCCFDPGVRDVEDFHVEDPRYLEVPAVPKPARKRHDWRCEDRQGHPKRYLEYLTDAELDGKGRYTETIHGCAALTELDWPTVVRGDARAPTVFARFARSLMADLVDMLGSSPVCPDLDALEVEHCHALTWPPPAENILRNL
ncbi:hypothetical protein ACNOYE_28555 [Nannocystaceae bacterium ST9]